MCDYRVCECACLNLEYLYSQNFDEHPVASVTRNKLQGFLCFDMGNFEASEIRLVFVDILKIWQVYV